MNKLALIFVLFIFILPIVNADLNNDFDGALPTYVSEYLSNGTNKNAIGDYRTISYNWSYAPASDEIVRLSRILITIGDASITDADGYGGNGELGTGISFWVEQNGVLTRIDGGLNLKTNGHLHRLAYDVNFASGSLGAGTDYVASRWSFDKTGTMIRLDGSTGDRIFINLNDTFTGLTEHYFLVQGYKEKKGGDVMASVAITIFLLSIIGGLFSLPFLVGKFSKNKFADLVMKRGCWLIGTYLMMFSSAIMATIAEHAGLDLTREMFRMMWFFGIAGWLFMGYMVIRTLLDAVALWKVDKEEKRMGGV